jgi:hypothetical protein
MPPLAHREVTQKHTLDVARTCAATMVSASHCVGLTLPGMMELPGSFSGSSSSPRPHLRTPGGQGGGERGGGMQAWWRGSSSSKRQQQGSQWQRSGKAVAGSPAARPAVEAAGSHASSAALSCAGCFCMLGPQPPKALQAQVTTPALQTRVANPPRSRSQEANVVGNLHQADSYSVERPTHLHDACSNAGAGAGE